MFPGLAVVNDLYNSASSICMIPFILLQTFVELFKASYVLIEEEEEVSDPQSDKQTSNEMWQVQASWDARLLRDVRELWRRNRPFSSNLPVPVPVVDRWVMPPLHTNNSKHPSIQFLYVLTLCRVTEGWSMSQHTLCERQVSTLTGRPCITRHVHTWSTSRSLCHIIISHFYSPTFQRGKLYFFLHYIYSTDIFTFDFTYKTYDQLIMITPAQVAVVQSYVGIYVRSLCT